MAPQAPLLNRNIWGSLEKYSQSLVEERGHKLLIYTGTILRDGREAIGNDKDVQVPDAFYKVVVIFENKGARQPTGFIAIIALNLTSGGIDPVSEHEKLCAESISTDLGGAAKTWKDYVVPLSELSHRAAVNFPFLTAVQPTPI